MVTGERIVERYCFMNFDRQPGSELVQELRPRCERHLPFRNVNRAGLWVIPALGSSEHAVCKVSSEQGRRFALAEINRR
jgi:hypothetical protein